MPCLDELTAWFHGSQEHGPGMLDVTVAELWEGFDEAVEKRADKLEVGYEKEQKAKVRARPEQA
jgi:hypothetical protein